MIYLDRRTGSKELFVPLQSRNVPVELTTLDYGDAAFTGRGPHGDVLIGIERKVTPDLLDSLTSGRLSGHQLPGMVTHYAYRWILVEGSYRPALDGSGFVEVPARRKGGNGWDTVRFQYQALESFLLTLTLRAGVHVQRTYHVNDSANWLAALWHWWNDKAWADHRSHLALHEPDPGVGLWTKPGLVHRVAAQLPGIDRKAIDVARHFQTVADMAVAGVDQWTQIPGVGKTGAKRLVKALQEPGAE